MKIRSVVFFLIVNVFFSIKAYPQDGVSGLLYNKYTTIDDDSLRLERIIHDAFNSVYQGTDSIEDYLNLIDFYKDSHDSIVWYPSINKIKSSLAFYSGFYSEALSYQYKNLLFIEKKYNVSKSERLTNMLAVNYGDMYVIYNELGRLSDAKRYCLRAKELYDQLIIINSRFYRPINHTVTLINLGELYIRLEEYFQAIEILGNAYELLLPIDDKKLKGIIYNKLSKAHLHLRNNLVALDYNKQSEYSFLEINETFHLVETYLQFGSIYSTYRDNKESLKYYEQAGVLAQKTRRWKLAKKSYNYLVKFYEEVDDYSLAFKYQKLLQIVSDSINNENRLRDISYMELNYDFQNKQNEREYMHQLNYQRKEKQLIIIRLIASITFLILGVIFLFALLQRKKVLNNKLEQKQLVLQCDQFKLQNDNLQLERDNLELKQLQMESELETKKRELTSYTLYLLQKKQFITDLANQLQELAPNVGKKAQPAMYRVISNLTSKTDDSLWKEFDIRFLEVHQSFYDVLNNLYPNLSLNERRLCAFLKLNMTTKEISSITYQSEQSIIVARSRLRKKLGMNRDENLSAFLNSLS